MDFEESWPQTEGVVIGKTVRGKKEDSWPSWTLSLGVQRTSSPAVRTSYTSTGTDSFLSLTCSEHPVSQEVYPLSEMPLYLYTGNCGAQAQSDTQNTQPLYICELRLGFQNPDSNSWCGQEHLPPNVTKSCCSSSVFNRRQKTLASHVKRLIAGWLRCRQLPSPVVVCV